MRILVTGSFDPPTLGHIDIIERALKISGDLIVCVMVNENKTAAFSIDERKEMLKSCIGNNVQVDSYDGWCYEYCKNHSIDTIIRGFRDAADYAYETEMAAFNKKHCGADTQLLLSDNKFSGVSSSKVKDLISEGEDLSEYLPEAVIDYIKRKGENTLR